MAAGKLEGQGLRKGRPYGCPFTTTQAMFYRLINGVRKARNALLTVTDRLTTEPLGKPIKSHDLTATATVYALPLMATTGRLSLLASGDARYCVVVSSEAPSEMDADQSHKIMDERLDIACDPGSWLVLKRDTAATADAKVWVTELT